MEDLKRDYDLAAASIREDPFKQYGDAGVTKDSNNELFEAQVLKNYKFAQDRYPFVMQELATAEFLISRVAYAGSRGCGQCSHKCGWSDCAGLVREPLRSGFTSSIVSAPATGFPTSWAASRYSSTGLPHRCSSFLLPRSISQVPWELGMEQQSTTPFTGNARRAHGQARGPVRPSAASLRGASTILSPLAVLLSALPLVIIPESVRSGTSARAVWRKLCRIGFVGSFAVITVGPALVLLPARVGELILGDSWDYVRVVLPIVSINTLLSFGAR